MTSNCNVNFSSPLKPPTLSTSALTNISAVLIIGAPAAARSAHHTERRGSQLTCSSTAACSRASNPAKQPITLDCSRLSCPPRPSRKRQAERASPKQISSSGRTERAVDLMNSWLRSKGVPPKHIWLVRHTRSAQPGSTNLSMPTTSPSIRLQLSSPCRQIWISARRVSKVPFQPLLGSVSNAPQLRRP